MTRWLLVWPLVLALAGSAGAQPKTVDNVAIDPNAELVVGMPDDIVAAGVALVLVLLTSSARER